MPITIGAGVRIGIGSTGTVTMAVPPLQFNSPAEMNN
jgi:hypothetical protein